MMKKWLALWFLLSITVLISAKKIATLTEVMKPFHFNIGHNRLYISEEKSQIHIYQFDYQTKEIKFLKTFGSYGKGPGELTYIDNFKILQDRIIVPNKGKYTQFTLDGEFIKEKKVTARVSKNRIEAVEDNFVTGSLIITGGDKGRTTSRIIRLYDRQFKLIKDLKTFAYDNKGKPLNMFAPLCTFSVYNKKIYIISSDEDTEVEILDKNGKLLKKMILTIPTIKITEEMNKNRMVYYKKDLAEDEDQWKRLKKMLYPSQYSPPVEYAWVGNERIYLKTYKRKEGLAEFLIYDLNGKELKKGFAYNTGPLYRGQLFTFIEDNMVYLKMDTDDEYWELHMEPIAN